MQVDSIKCHVEGAYGFSTGSYNMMHRLQTLVVISTCAATAWEAAAAAAAANARDAAEGELRVMQATMRTEAQQRTEVGRCNLYQLATRVETPLIHSLKLNVGEQLSYFAFNFNLRRHSEAFDSAGAAASAERSKREAELADEIEQLRNQSAEHESVLRGKLSAEAAARADLEGRDSRMYSPAPHCVSVYIGLLLLIVC